MAHTSHHPAATQASTLQGFAHPVFDSQCMFRAAAMAMAQPGQPRVIGDTAGRPLQLPHIEGVHAASLALLLALADLDTPIWLDERLLEGHLPAYLRFHTGADITPERQVASFALFAAAYEGSYTTDFAIGLEAYPERSATLLVQVADFTSGAPRRMRGPGIETTETFRIAGLGPQFWSEWQLNQALYPCGLDVMLTAGHALLGLPRSVREEA